MNEHILRTFDLCKKYNGQYVVENVSMEISKGQIYGFIGANGAGKTTFIRLICGLTHSECGEIELFGERGPNLESARRRIGSIIEMPALYTSMTAWQNLEAYRLLTGTPGKNRIEEVLNSVKLLDCKEKKVSHFSFGMKQRLALAKALLHQPEFLILDEPMNGLDPSGIILIREMLRELCEKHNITILISSHILGELSLLATHYGIIHRGKLIRQISKEELDRECRQYIKISTCDVAKASVILQEKLHTHAFEVMPDNIIYLFDYLDRPESVNECLVKEGVPISLLTLMGQDLEGYFMQLVGGGKNE